MKYALYVLLLFVAVSGAAGCAMCENCYDEAYPTYGGKWQRADRFRGRVGSAFAPAEAQVIETVESGYAPGTVYVEEYELEGPVMP